MSHQPTPRPFNCPDCGHLHFKCLAHKRKTDPPLPCKGEPINGADVCRLHGGTAPQVREAAGERVQVAMMEKAVRSLALPIEIDHMKALLDELARTNGAVLWLGEIVAGLEKEDVVWGKVEEVLSLGEGTGLEGGNTRTATRSHAARLNLWVDLWQKERRHLVTVAKICHDVGIADRQIVLAEEQGKLMAEFVRAFIDDPDLDLDETKKMLATQIASRRLLQLRAG